MYASVKRSQKSPTEMSICRPEMGSILWSFVGISKRLFHGKVKVCLSRFLFLLIRHSDSDRHDPIDDLSRVIHGKSSVTSEGQNGGLPTYLRDEFVFAIRIFRST